MSRKVLFFVISIVYLIIILYGLNTVYNVEATLRVKEVPAVKPENRIAIAHTEIFGSLERPQVIFDHHKHTEAYKQEGCNECHPVQKSADKSDKLHFDFPKVVKKKDKTSVMEAYHDECIECHKKMSREDKKAGPVNCGDCHKEIESALVLEYPVVEFDFSLHDKHVKELKEKIGKDDCGLCHHTYDLEEENEELALKYEEGTEQSCYYCHEVGKKRGPEYGAITRVAAKKGLTIRKASHQQCLNCHLKYQEEKEKSTDKEAGPTECMKCHTGEYKTVAELEKVPRPDRGQKEKPDINIKDAKLKGVTFDHKYHETTSKTCRSCHHESLKPCKECHDLVGKPEGNGINVATAYHDPFSEHSCEGCHNEIKKEKECAGCHSNIPVVAIDSIGPKKESCSICHSGKIEGPLSRPALSTAHLNTDIVKKEVEIDILKREYESSKFPHLEIIRQLVDISNKSKLANYFHKDMQVLCEGCHHRSTEAAEAKKDTPPYCRNCHTVTYNPQDLNKTTLLSSYHRQCLGCHDKMELEKGRKCSDCHKPKEGEPARITDLHNKDVVMQNTENILNVWRPE